MDYEQREDGVYAYNAVTDTYHKVSDTPSLTPQQRAAAQAEEYMRGVELQRESEEKRQSAIASHERAEDLAGMIARRKQEQQLDEQREWEARIAKEEDHKRIRKSIDAARERYQAKSPLYKFFHKSFDRSVIGKTADEINELYGGIQEEEGKRR